MRSSCFDLGRTRHWKKVVFGDADITRPPIMFALIHADINFLRNVGNWPSPCFAQKGTGKART